MEENKILTFEEFEKLPFKKPFASGVIDNSPEGLFMTTEGGQLRWVAKKGTIQDWAIYCQWSNLSEEYILKYGDKVQNNKHILKCVPCDERTLKNYRH